MKKPIKNLTVLERDLEQTPIRLDHIKCPRCEKIQSAKVLETWPWHTYIHECVQCGHTITESEWDSIQ